MSKVYLVTSGEYSDYGVEAVFTDKADAEKYAQIISRRYHEAEVEEWDLNPNMDDIRNDRRPFFVRISQEGNVKECSTDYSVTSGHGFDISYNMYTTVWASDENHARKIAAERHAVVAAQGWPVKKP